MERILLSTYAVKILNNTGDEQRISYFNGTDDFFGVFENFLNSIFETILGTASIGQSSSIHLTLDAPPVVDIENRRIYGYFSSGVSGEEYSIRDVDTREQVLNVQRNHAAFRNVFFYLHIPVNSTRAALILQRKAKFGVKTILAKSLNTFLREQGYQSSRLLIDNILHGQVYRIMMDEGNLKKVEFIKRRIPNSIEEYYSNDGEPDQIPGVLKTSWLSATSLPREYKRLVNNLFTNPNNERIEIAGIDEEFDEVEFELELNGKRKSFYVANRSKIQPDIDVTSQVQMENGSPTTSSLASVSAELVSDVIDLR